MTWLQKRLDELGYTHEDLRRFLSRHGIERSRVAITGWTNGNPIPLLSNPHEASILAEALKWELLDLMMAAGYNIGIQSEFIYLIQQYNNLSSFQRKLFMMTSRQFILVVSNLSEAQVEEALQVGE